MKIVLTIQSKPVGYIEYDLVNSLGMVGVLGPIYVQPNKLLSVITDRIKNNKSIAVSGGFIPPDLSQYFDGIVMVLEGLKEEIAGFSYTIPPEENPYLEDEDLRLEMSRRVN